jgi:8-oxo-dGTP diphosphatase
MARNETVHAAGGLVWRRRQGQTGGLEVVLVHRPKYDDWTFPKGKREAGETDEENARREVDEETGLACRLGPELPPTHYVDSRGRPKVVRYWAMTVESRIERSPDDEVDEWRWVGVAEAAELLSYAIDRPVLAALRTVAERGANPG